MRFRSIATALFSLGFAASLSAQDLAASVCPAGAAPGGIPDQTRAAQDACQQAYDLYHFMAPQLGLGIVGGSTTMGQGGALGGLGHFAIGIRANVFNGEIPDVASFTQSVNGAQRQTLPTEKHIVGLPTVDAAIGLFKGFPLALSNVGGIDLLLNASYVPTIDDEGVTITPKNNWSFGYGARLGLLQESLIVPGISVSWMKRDLPETDIAGSAGSGVSTASFTIDNFRVETSAWRVMASKSLVLFSLHAGVGQETYDQSADISASVSQPPFSGNVSVPDTEQKLTRTNFFGGVALNLMILKIVAEVGQSSGGTIETFNSFSGGRADRSQQYGSVGIRFGF